MEEIICDALCLKRCLSSGGRAPEAVIPVVAAPHCAATTSTSSALGDPGMVLTESSVVGVAGVHDDVDSRFASGLGIDSGSRILNVKPFEICTSRVAMDIHLLYNQEDIPE